MVHQEGGDITVVNLLRHINLNPVHHMVGAAVEDDALYVGQGLQLGQCNVVGVDFGVDPQRADLPGNFRVFLTAQVQYYNHVLFHSQIASFVTLCLYPTIVQSFCSIAGKNSSTKSTCSTWNVFPLRCSSGPAGVVKRKVSL